MLDLKALPFFLPLPQSSAVFIWPSLAALLQEACLCTCTRAPSSHINGGSHTHLGAGCCSVLLLPELHWGGLRQSCGVTDVCIFQSAAITHFTPQPTVRSTVCSLQPGQRPGGHISLISKLKSGFFFPATKQYASKRCHLGLRGGAPADIDRAVYVILGASRAKAHQYHASKYWVPTRLWSRVPMVHGWQDRQAGER